MSFRNFLTVGLCLLAGLASATSLRAQATLGSSSASGTVSDTTGAVIPGASVTLTDEARGLAREAETNAVGLYVFPDVPPGIYNLRVQREGFDTYELTEVRLEVGRRATMNVELQVGQVTDTITVEGAGETILLETESNTLGSVIDSERVEELPLNGRNFLQLTTLSGGSNEPVGRSNAAGQNGHPGRAVVVAGNKASYTGYLINGIQVRSSRMGELALNLSVANVDQFKVQESFFMADQGPNPALINVNTKGGGNSFHGQAFEFLRNTKLDARNYFAPAAEELKRNQFGFFVGGPIVRDKIWFYAGYEGLRQKEAFSRRAFTPTQTMFGGDFTELAAQIYDPLSFSEASGTRQPFTNNVIPDNRINPVSKRLLPFYLPGSSLSQRPSNVFGNPLNTLDDDQYNIRVDASLTAKQNIFGQFIYSDSPVIRGGLMPLSGASYPNEVQLGMLQHTYTISPTLVNTFRIGASRNVALFANEAREGGDILTAIGILETHDVRGVTSQRPSGFAGWGRSNGDLGNKDNNYQLDEGVNWVKGSHQFSFGTSIRYRKVFLQSANAAAHGTLQYQPTFSAQLGPDAQNRPVPQRGTGSSFADFLMGMNTTGRQSGLPELPYHFTQYMPYFQDTWKVASNFTINYGISWFKDTLPNPQGDFAPLFPHIFDVDTQLLKFAALGEIDPRVLEADNDNFTPRFGFAWQLTPNTVIRSGVGVYFSDIQAIEMQFAAIGPPFTLPTTVNNGQLNPLPRFELGRNIFPPSPLPTLDQDFAKNLPPGQTPFLLEPASRTPYVSQWNFSLQHTLGDNDMVELTYMGHSGHKLQNRFDFNQCIVAGDLSCGGRPFVNYGPMLMSTFNGNSSYNALVTKYRHRVSGGLTLNFEYTWGKSLIDGWEINDSTRSQIANCRACDKGFSSFDVANRGVISTIWQLPFGRGRGFGSSASKAADMILGGWSVTTIMTLQTGAPFEITQPRTAGQSFVRQRPNRTCSGEDSSLNSNLRSNGGLFFDTSCFTQTGPGLFGNTAAYPIHGPGLNNWDIGIQKVFPINEEVRVQFRTEMFNAFNHAQFNTPNGNRGSVNFGRISSARAPRLIQFGLKVIF